MQWISANLPEVSWSESISCACSSAWALKDLKGRQHWRAINACLLYYCIDTKARAQAFQEKISLLQSCDSKVTTSHSSLSAPFSLQKPSWIKLIQISININQHQSTNPPFSVHQKRPGSVQSFRAVRTTKLSRQSSAVLQAKSSWIISWRSDTMWPTTINFENKENQQSTNML